MKRRGQPIVMVTAYDHPSGSVANAAGVDLVLVGDSAATVMLGYDSTVPVSMDEMVMLTRATTRGATRPLVVADLPFMSYQTDDRDAILAAGRMVKEGGADAVKVEGAGTTLQRIAAITGAGMPVMGHLGLTPQTATVLGGYKAQGRNALSALALVRDASAIEAAGAFALVLECVPPTVARAISERLTIPTIGIGAGSGTDGQVLVYHDLLGLGEVKPPRVVEQYADLRSAAIEGVRRYAADVRDRSFPAARHEYTMPVDEAEAFADALLPANPVVGEI